MGMLSYKNYQLLQERLDGIRLSEAPQLVGMMGKMKKMGAGKPGMPKPGLGDEDEDMGGLGGPPDPAMGGPMGGGDDADMDDPDALDAGDDADVDDPDALDDEDDMDDEDGDLDDEEDGDGEDEEEDGDAPPMDDMGDMGGPMGAGSPPPGMGGPMGGPDMGMGLGGPPMKKKPMPPMMMKKMYMKKEASDPQDAKMKGQNKKNGANDQDIDKPGTCQKKTTFVKEVSDPQDAKMKAQNKKNKANDQDIDKPGTAQKKTTFVKESCCDKCGNMMKKKSKKCCKEQTEFEDSLKRQTGSLKFTRDELGFWVPVNEDILVPVAQKAQVQQQEEEPEAGEVGFAPQGKIGIIGSNFQEWVTRHTNAVKKRQK